MGSSCAARSGKSSTTTISPTSPHADAETSSSLRRPYRTFGAPRSLWRSRSPMLVRLTMRRTAHQRITLQRQAASSPVPYCGHRHAPGSGAYALPVVDVQRRVREGGLLRNAPQARSSRASQKFRRRMSALRAHAVEGGFAGATSGALLSWPASATVANSCLSSLIDSYLLIAFHSDPLGTICLILLDSSSTRKYARTIMLPIDS